MDLLMVRDRVTGRFIYPEYGPVETAYGEPGDEQLGEDRVGR